MSDELKKSKSTQVKFRLNDDELKVWKARASERNLTVPKFAKQTVQQAIDKGRIKQPKIDKGQGVEIIKHLANTGGNLNQIARWCNSHKEEQSEELANRLAFNLEEVRKEIHEIWQQLK